MVNKEGFPTRDGVRKSVKEGVDKSTHEIMWFLGGADFKGDYTERKAPPYLVKYPRPCKETEKGILITDKNGHQVIFVNRDYDIKWEYGEFGVSGSSAGYLNSPGKADYDPDKERVLIADWGNKRVIEVDYKTKEIVNKLDGFPAGSFSDWIMAKYDPRHTERRVLVVDRDNHYAAEMDWGGNTSWTFGSYGSAGSGDTDLDGPRGIAPFWFYRRGYHLIADYNNNAVKALKENGGGPIYSLRMFNPVSVWSDKIRGKFIWSIGTPKEPALLLEGWDVSWTGWTGGTHTSLTKDMTILTRRHNQVWEIDWKRHPHGGYQEMEPRQEKPLDDKSLDANEDSDIFPFLAFPFDMVKATALSDQAATLKVYSLKGAKPHQPLCGDWYLYDTVDLTANDAAFRTYGNLTGVLGFRITMGGTAGTVNLWIERK